MTKSKTNTEANTESITQLSKKALELYKNPNSEVLNPFFDPTVLGSCIRTVLSQQEHLDMCNSVVIILPDLPVERDIMIAIAVKHFFEENSVPCSIHIPENDIDRLQIPVFMQKELTSELPEGNDSFIALALAVITKQELRDRSYKKTFLFMSIVGSHRAPTREQISLHFRSDNKAQTTIEPVLEEMLAIKDTQLPLYSYPFDPDKTTLSSPIKVSQRVVTDLFLASLYAIESIQTISHSLYSTIEQLLNLGASPEDARYRYTSISKYAFNFCSLLVPSITVNDSLAYAAIPYSDWHTQLETLIAQDTHPKTNKKEKKSSSAKKVTPKQQTPSTDNPYLVDDCFVPVTQEPLLSQLRNDWVQAVRTFRQLQGAPVWLVCIEEVPGRWYCIIQSRKQNGIEYNCMKVAKNNNGVGSPKLAKCHIYEDDLTKIVKDVRALITNAQTKNS